MVVVVMVGLFLLAIVVLLLALASSERLRERHSLPEFALRAGAALNGEGDTPRLFVRLFEG